MGRRSFERGNSLFERDDTLLSAVEEFGRFLEVGGTEGDESEEVVEGFVRGVGVGGEGELEKRSRRRDLVSTNVSSPFFTFRTTRNTINRGIDSPDNEDASSNSSSTQPT